MMPASRWARPESTGIEQAMESTLRGRPGRETFYVDSVGRVTQVLNSEEPAAGEDV